MNAPTPTRGYRRILVAVDCSDHSNAATEQAVALAGLWEAQIAGLHAYAARLHDVRFRQMEGGLPERYRKEDELERQRDVHDDLITKGLEVISDSYLDQTEQRCAEAGIRFSRLAGEGRNWRVIVNEARHGGHDLLVLGAQGLGAVRDGVIGTVCERVVRRTPVDALVIKQPDRPIGSGPILVGIDGSPKSYGCLLTAIELGRRFDAPVHAVAVHDPYFHYVAFNRIARVLSEEAGKVFKFEEQEQLHEEIIDSGLEKIYQSHLNIAQALAKECTTQIETTLVAGKPWSAILKLTEELEPSLLILGKVGIHGEGDLDIGGNTQHLLRLAGCNLLIGVREHVPDVETVAEETISWSEEAEERMQRIPGFVQRMARLGILRYAQDRGHTVITASIVDEATANLCPAGHSSAEARCPAGAESAAVAEGRSLPWDADAEAALERVPAGFMRKLTAQRVEAMASSRGEARVTAAIVALKLDSWGAHSAEVEAQLPWDADASAVIERAPPVVRGMIVREVEAGARRDGVERITLAYFSRARKDWQETGMFHAPPEGPGVR